MDSNSPEDNRIYGKRFEVATNPVAKERLDAFRAGMKNFQMKHSEVLGATVFGSMIRGAKANAESDIDAFLYIDEEALPEEDRLQNPKKIETKYRTELLEKLKVPQKDITEYYEHLIPKILSAQIIENNINSNIAYENKLMEHNKMLQDAWKNEMSDKEKSDLYAETPEREMPNDDFEIAGMFHAKVGSGIEKYRHLFLERLAALPDPEMAQKIWMNVYAGISTMEGTYDKKRKLPSTFMDGVRIYHPELFKKIQKKKDEKRAGELRNKLENAI